MTPKRASGGQKKGSVGKATLGRLLGALIVVSFGLGVLGVLSSAGDASRSWMTGWPHATPTPAGQAPQGEPPPDPTSTPSPTPQPTALKLGTCQCTDYVYSQRLDIEEGMGQARAWLASARARRLPYDQVPQVGDIAVFLNGVYGFSAEYGHVAIVTEVNEDRTRFNIAGWDGLKADCALETYPDLLVNSNTYFIHYKDIRHRLKRQSRPLVSRVEIAVSPQPPAPSDGTMRVFVLVFPDRDYRAARLLIDDRVVHETSAARFSFEWKATPCDVGSHRLRVEVANGNYHDWSLPEGGEMDVLLKDPATAKASVPEHSPEGEPPQTCPS